MIAGDNNSDPLDGDSVPGAIQQLQYAARVIDPMPGSIGDYRAAQEQDGANLTLRGNPHFDTADFDDKAPANSGGTTCCRRGLVPLGGEAFWPVSDSPLARLDDASDHHLARQDIFVPGR